LTEIAVSAISGFSGFLKEIGKTNSCLLHYNRNSDSSFYPKEAEYKVFNTLSLETETILLNKIRAVLQIANFWAEFTNFQPLEKFPNF
jgi:hypothetical protein